MIAKTSLKKKSDFLWEISKSFNADMRVPAQIFTSERMLDEIFKDKSLEQLVNVATLPGIVKAAIAMPDIHQGYGFPIGGIGAFEYPDGVVSPGGIGYDINCGVKLLISELSLEEIKSNLEKLADEIFRAVPSGLGRGGRTELSPDDLDEVLGEGIDWAIEKGYATTEDRENIESEGKMLQADPIKVSNTAKGRGRDQLGTVGAGNHFVEVGFIDEIYDQELACGLGLVAKQVTLMIHCGSRGLGHQVATDYIKVMLDYDRRNNIILSDRELAFAPYSSGEGKDYFQAMAAAANYAWVNRQLIAWEIRNEWKRMFPSDALKTLYDVAHNIAKIEDHEIDGKMKKLIIERKGATRAFPPGHPDLNEKYQKTGQPVLVPGSMGSASYILAGADDALKKSFGSSAHGAGRAMSRGAAKRKIRGQVLINELKKQGIIIKTGSMSGLAEEAPFAYKDIGNVVDIIEKAGIAKKVVRLKPLVVIKG